MMFEYVHHELIPKLMLKREASGLFDDNGDNYTNVVGETASKIKFQIYFLYCRGAHD